MSPPKLYCQMSTLLVSILKVSKPPEKMRVIQSQGSSDGCSFIKFQKKYRKARDIPYPILNREENIRLLALFLIFPNPSNRVSLAARSKHAQCLIVSEYYKYDGVSLLPGYVNLISSFQRNKTRQDNYDIWINIPVALKDRTSNLWRVSNATGKTKKNLRYVKNLIRSVYY